MKFTPVDGEQKAAQLVRSELRELANAAYSAIHDPTDLRY